VGGGSAKAYGTCKKWDSLVGVDGISITNMPTDVVACGVVLTERSGVDCVVTVGTESQ